MKIVNLTFSATFEYEKEVELTDEEFESLENAPSTLYYGVSKGDDKIIDIIEKYVDLSCGWETSINDIFIEEIEEIEDEEVM